MSLTHETAAGGVPIMELIRARRSVRTFDGNPLRSEDAARILAFSRQAENPFGVPIVWRLLSQTEDRLSSPVIVGADTWIAGKLPQVPHAELAFGFALERILLYAQSLGIGATWIAGTMDRTTFERAIAPKAGERMPCVSPLGYPAAKMSVRETLMRKGVRAESRMDFGALFFAGDFDRPLTPEQAGPHREALEAVRLAPSAVNKQPWRVMIDGETAHFYEKHAKGYVDASGWDLQKIDLGIALCHYALVMEESGTPLSLTVADPGIPAPKDVSYVASLMPE